MTHLHVPYETVLGLVEQLPLQQQQNLLHWLQEHVQREKWTVDEKMKLLRAAQIDVAVSQEPSPRREDCYDDNGR